MEKPRHLSPPTLEGTTLGRRFLAHEKSALRHVERIVGAVIFARAFSIAHADRQDLIQEVMTQVWAAVSREGFDFTRSFESFVRVVAIRRCADWVRSLRPLSPLNPDIPHPGSGPLTSLVAKERSELVHMVIDRLRDACRELFRLYVYEKKTYRQIARLVDRSEGALRVQMHQCLQEARGLVAKMIAARQHGGTAS